MNCRAFCFGLCGAVIVAALAFGAASAHLPSAASPPAACQELVVNGGFEQMRSGWTQQPANGIDLIDQIYPFTDDWGANLGGLTNSDHSLMQTITLPDGFDSIQLSFWWSLRTTEDPGGAFDFAYAQLLTMSGDVVTTTQRIHNFAAEDYVWNLANADLKSYAGRSMQLRLRATNDATAATNFFFDDVSILACAEGSATPTPTATSPAPPTATAWPRLFLPTLLK
jgi:hypothetical protein